MMRLFVLLSFAFLYSTILYSQTLIPQTKNQEIRALTSLASQNVTFYANKHIIYQIDSTFCPKEFIVAPNAHVIRCIEIDTLNNFLISAGKGKNIYIWDLNTKELIKKAELKDNLVTSIALSLDRSQIAAASASGSINIWSYPEMNKQACFQGHKTICSSIVFSKNGEQIISADMAGKIKIWTNHSFHLQAELHKNNGCIYKICSGINDTDIYTASSKSKLTHWSYVNGYFHEQNDLSLHMGPISDFIIFGEMENFSAISLNGEISISVQFGRYTAKIKDALTCITRISSPNKNLKFLIGSLNKGLFVLNAKDMTYHPL